MSWFLQLHLLTSYPPANLNRDDLGRPKTAIVGGKQRLRVSSQSLKRAWRTSAVFEDALAGHIGTRTQKVGQRVLDVLKAAGLKEGEAKPWAVAIAQQFGTVKDIKTEQIAHLSPEELAAVDALAARLADEKRAPTEEDLKLLRATHRAADIALFGRMLAEAPGFNTDAAAQVAHAITVHAAAVEDDYFTAVDDLNKREDTGAGHVNQSEFGAGIFYLYLCIDRDLLVRNLQGDEALAARTLRALVQAAATVAPNGKQNSYASRAYASYVLAEVGQDQPRSLSAAFLGDLPGEHPLKAAIGALETTRQNFAACYGNTWTGEAKLDVTAGAGSLAEILEFVAAHPGS